MKLLKRYQVKVPKGIKLIYKKKAELLHIIGPSNKKTVKVKIELIFLKEERALYVTSKYSNPESVTYPDRKNIKVNRGTLTALLKQQLIEIEYMSLRNLRVVGVGYKIIPLEVGKDQVLKLKLGYSHLIFFKINTTKVKISCLKSINLFILGNSYCYVSQLAAKIRGYKKPEPYKGKGILYKDENIVLKEGKKI